MSGGNSKYFKIFLIGCNTKKLYFYKFIILLYFLALKGRNIPAQGNALGKIYYNDLSPERATPKLTMIKGRPFM